MVCQSIVEYSKIKLKFTTRWKNEILYNMKTTIKRNIILIGSMGSGKSHLGRNLADAKGWQFVDTDRILEKRYNMPIADIFKTIGEKAFRRAEFEVIKKVAMYHEAVISVGGNFPVDMRTLRYMQKYSFIVGIRASHYRFVNRVNRWVGKRPTMNYDDVSGYVAWMMRRWKPLYRKCDHVLDTTYSHTDELVTSIDGSIKSKGIYFKRRKVHQGE